VPKYTDPDLAVATMFSVIRNASVPFGIATPDQPNISSTRWRTVADHRRRLYFFESALTPNAFWVDLKKVDFTPGTGQVKVLRLGEHQKNVFAGETSAKFEVSRPFAFLGLPAK